MRGLLSERMPPRSARSPSAARKRGAQIAWGRGAPSVAEQVQKLRFGQAAVGDIEKRKGVADEAGPVPLVILFVPRQDEGEERRNARRLKVVGDPPFELFVGAELAQLVDERLQEEGIGGMFATRRSCPRGGGSGSCRRARGTCGQRPADRPGREDPAYGPASRGGPGLRSRDPACWRCPAGCLPESTRRRAVCREGTLRGASSRPKVSTGLPGVPVRR